MPIRSHHLIIKMLLANSIKKLYFCKCNPKLSHLTPINALKHIS